jgi:hypothetical protein
MLVFLIATLLSAGLIYLFIYYKYKFIFGIKAKTIHLQKPIVLANNTTQRNSVINSRALQKLIEHETHLRKKAYSNTSIKTAESFFNDTDMQSDYFLIIIYNHKTNTPLLSARYYFDKAVISKCLKGDDATTAPILNPYKFNDNRLFLIDRMSANHNHSTYRKHRNYIHLLFYFQLYIYNKNCKFIAMARKQKFEKLLTKYIRLGLNIVGTTKHMGKEHWVLLGDFKKNRANAKQSILVNIFLLTKVFIAKFK